MCHIVDVTHCSKIKNHNPRKGTETWKNDELFTAMKLLKIIIPVRGRKLFNLDSSDLNLKY